MPLQSLLSLLKPSAGLVKCVVLHARASPSKPNAVPPLRGTHYGTDLRSFDRAASSRVRANRIEAAKGVASQTKRGNTMSNDTNSKTRPTHRIYSVTKNGDRKATWQEIGAAWPHKDGKGFNLTFTARPLDGAQIVLREPKAAKGGAQ